MNFLALREEPLSGQGRTLGLGDHVVYVMFHPIFGMNLN